MAHKRITAIVRTTRMKEVMEALCRHGIPGVTATHVMGLGEYRNYFCRDPMVEHIRLELFVPEEDADDVAATIISAGRTGCSGDGVVAIGGLEHLMRIRTGREIEERDRSHHTVTPADGPHREH